MNMKFLAGASLRRIVSKEPLARRPFTSWLYAAEAGPSTQ